MVNLTLAADQPSDEKKHIPTPSAPHIPYLWNWHELTLICVLFSFYFFIFNIIMCNCMRACRSQTFYTYILFILCETICPFAIYGISSHVLICTQFINYLIIVFCVCCRVLRDKWWSFALLLPLRSDDRRSAIIFMYLYNTHAYGIDYIFFNFVYVFVRVVWVGENLHILWRQVNDFAIFFKCARILRYFYTHSLYYLYFFSPTPPCRPHSTPHILFF